MAYQEPNKDGILRKIRRYVLSQETLMTASFGVGEGLP